MNTLHPVLGSVPFHTEGEPSKFVEYRSQREAAMFLKQTYTNDNGLGLFLGPRHVGKSTILRHFIKQLPEDTISAVVNGSKHDVTSLLGTILEQFGYVPDWPSVNDMMNLLKVVAVRKTSLGYAPLLVIENIHAMNPNTIHVVCQLAMLKLHKQSALRIVLVGDRSLSMMLSAPALSVLANRKTGEHELGCMTRAESTYYLDAKLRSAGIDHPESVVPPTVCDELFEESGGRPGLIDKYVLQRLALTDQLPLSPQAVMADDVPTPVQQAVVASCDSEAGFESPELIASEEMLESSDDVAEDLPRLTITSNGKTLGIFTLEKSRLLIGRSDYNDIAINSNCISRHHALLIRDKGVTILIDLNSRNGTFVNSRKITCHVLRHDDVISLGNHRLKLFDAGCRQRMTIDKSKLSETAKMRVLGDKRRENARQRVRAKGA